MEYGDGNQGERKKTEEEGEEEKKMKSGVKEIVDLVVHVILVEGERCGLDGVGINPK